MKDLNDLLSRLTCYTEFRTQYLQFWLDHLTKNLSRKSVVKLLHISKNPIGTTQDSWLIKNTLCDMERIVPVHYSVTQKSTHGSEWTFIRVNPFQWLYAKWTVTYITTQIGQSSNSGCF